MSCVWYQLLERPITVFSFLNTWIHTRFVPTLLIFQCSTDKHITQHRPMHDALLCNTPKKNIFRYVESQKFHDTPLHYSFPFERVNIEMFCTPAPKHNCYVSPNPGLCAYAKNSTTVSEAEHNGATSAFTETPREKLSTKFAIEPISNDECNCFPIRHQFFGRIFKQNSIIFFQQLGIFLISIYKLTRLKATYFISARKRPVLRFLLQENPRFPLVLWLEMTLQNASNSLFVEYGFSSANRPTELHDSHNV